MIDERWEMDTLFLVFEEDFRFYPEDGDGKVRANARAQPAPDLAQEGAAAEPKTGRKVPGRVPPLDLAFHAREPSARAPGGFQFKAGPGWPVTPPCPRRRHVSLPPMATWPRP